MTTTDRWADLRVRVVSAAVLIVLACVEIWLGGIFFRAAVAVLVAVMIWELAGLTDAPSAAIRLGLGGLAALCLWLAPGLGAWGWLLLLLPVAGFAVTLRRNAGLLAAYALALMVAGLGFMTLRGHGAGMFVWLVVLVVVSDSLGYFAGRSFGGPKFWPQISPKKTWAGTVAGWCGAGVVGLVFAAAGVVPMAYALLSPLIAFAGQMGDIAESWIKRRAGAKDSSNLIPGHGGVLDRFDALVGAMLALQLLGLMMDGTV